jgi:IPT/TIG domain-containing protein
MRRISTAVTAAALAFSMLALALPAAAVAGFDSQYNSESAFVNINPGQTQNFQVFFINAGTTTWTRGTSTQVDLAACLEDKVTCNAQDANEAAWNTNWLSANRYATTSNTSVAPGAVATFSYNVTAPAGAPNGIYRFNGDLVLSTTGERIHPEGYYQEANLGGAGTGGAATITSITPTNTGTAAGGDARIINGSNIVCTPAFPAVSFGGTAAAVTSCGSTAVSVTTPAHAPGNVTVTLTNSGAAASNGLTFTYTDTTKPTFDSIAVAGDVITVTFSEAVCRQIPWSNTTHATGTGDWSINNVSNPGLNIADTGDTIPTCSPVGAPTNGVTTAQIITNTIVPPGSFVEVTANETTAGAGTNGSIRDQSSAANTLVAPQARTATAGSLETIAPTLLSVSGAVGATQITLTFSEPVWCDPAATGAVLPGTNPWLYDSSDITLDDGASTTTDPTASGSGTNPCPTLRANASSSFTVALGTALPSDRTYTVSVTPEPNDVQDTARNDLAAQSVTFTTGAGDFTPPTIIDARLVNNLITTDFTEPGDSFSATFSEEMNQTTTGDTLQIQDQDGTVFSLSCGGNVTCTWNTAGTTITVTITGAAIPAPPVGSAGAGSTPGMQIPFNITTLNGFMDLQGNVPNVLGSSDRLVDYE